MSCVYLPHETVYHIQLLYVVITINYLKLQNEIVVGTQIVMDISNFSIHYQRKAIRSINPVMVRNRKK